ncbi:hypothetical protein Cgig2_001586 [Carnegiea gigantea]|uniref:Uncharacterized protein n=1 Tax=Carnegiea gigantea TaxID=171969 RepID=A0A9Q1QG25_9CARY|nr:hypothetical protein Cgig2_001586 [Carnegiea gigantea]
MAESNTNSPSTSTSATISSPNQSMVVLPMIALLVPTLASALFLFWVDPFDPAQIPSPELTRVKAPVIVPKVSGWILQESEFVGSGQVLGPEDMVYEPSSQVLYTGCADGWVKRVKLGESASDIVVEDWVNTGGRPLGLAIAAHGADVIVGDAHKAFEIGFTYFDAQIS